MPRLASLLSREAVYCAIHTRNGPETEGTVLRRGPSTRTTAVSFSVTNESLRHPLERYEDPLLYSRPLAHRRRR